MKRLMSDLIRFFEHYTPCDISDALVKYGHKTGGFIPNLTQFSPGKQSMVGRAYTVLYAPLDDPRPELKVKYIDEIPKDSVVVIGTTKELQSPYAPYVKLNNALYGGLMSTRAQYLGAKGSLILGRIRDLDEHRDLGYPVFSYGVGTTAPGSMVKVIGVNVPIDVTVGESSYDVIHSGDWIIGDVNGIVKIPNDEELLAKLVEYIPKRVEADTLVAKDIKEGKPAGDSQKLRRANL
jgi:regulator of RNase E activity RraA